MKKCLSMALGILFVMSSSVPALANSAPRWLEGVQFAGTMTAEENCPITVEQETLTFDIQEFPQEHYAEREPYLAYSGKVTAAYTFHNPTAEEITATLVFPFGQTPNYGYSYDRETEERVYAVDGEKYDITVDGAPIEKTVRHTLSYPWDDFSLENDLPKLNDGYREDDFYSLDLPVTKYTYAISGVDEENHAATAAFDWRGDLTKTKLMLEQQCGGGTLEDGISVHMWVNREEGATLYVFGEPLTEELDWKFYEDGGCDKEIPGEMTLTATESMTFAEFIEAVYGTGEGVLPADWYNAIVESLHRSEWEYGVLGNFEYDGGVAPDDLLRWYEYEITIPAGGRIVNTVTAPIYPTIDNGYEPPVYAYTYLLSPAQTWASFGRLELAVNTPYFLTESSLEGLQKTETGYALSMKGLPEGELTFSLSAEETPKEAAPYPSAWRLPLGVLVILCGGAGFFIGYLVTVMMKKRK